MTSHPSTDELLEGVDLDGTTVLITGASSGLGVETARALAAHGARLVLAVRDPDRAAGTLADAGIDVGAHDLRRLDLADLASVRAFTDDVLATVDRLDVLVANAGIMAVPQATTTDGFEAQLGTNHLGHLVLVGRLAPLLLRSTPARVVVVASAGHRIADVDLDLDDPGFARTPYDPWVAYGRSKTANVLFAVELDRRLGDRGVRAAAVHPGEIHTGLGRHLTESTLAAMREMVGERPMVFKPVEMGAATSVWAAVVADADEIGGRYCEDCAVSAVTTDPASTTGVFPHAVDPERARRLWTWSEQLVGETFDL
ncbi:MAG TPA: SDR family NAD(P)-dependent oxidoreductase [Iamia sp.]|nr:SDR family NAD(P)-dependent oxidoreductase [Iamia sp.]